MARARAAASIFVPAPGTLPSFCTGVALFLAPALASVLRGVWADTSSAVPCVKRMPPSERTEAAIRPTQLAFRLRWGDPGGAVLVREPRWAARRENRIMFGAPLLAEKSRASYPWRRAALQRWPASPRCSLGNPFPRACSCWEGMRRCGNGVFNPDTLVRFRLRRLI